MSWTVAKERGAVAFSDWLARESRTLSADQLALLEAFRSHPPISLRLAKGADADPDPFEATGGGHAVAPGAARGPEQAPPMRDDPLDDLAVIILVVDANGAVASANRAISAMLGYAPEDIVGRKVLSLLTRGSRHTLVKDHLARFRASRRLTDVAVDLVTGSGGTAAMRMTAIGDSDGAGRNARALVVLAPRG